MAKYSVNLIIKKEAETPFLKKLKLILPLVAVVSLALFVVTFFASLIYINNHTTQFNLLKRQVEALEKKIADGKNIEGIYTLTVNRVSTLNQIVKTNKNFWPVVEEINKIQKEGVSVTQVSLDKTGALLLSVTASNSATLDDFVASLILAENKKIFSDIKTGGIVRDKNGAYLLSINMKSNPNLLQ